MRTYAGFLVVWCFAALLAATPRLAAAQAATLSASITTVATATPAVTAHKMQSALA